VEGFAGMMSIDDVIKPDDANSPGERDKINNRYGNTLLSRLATETTPLVIIMQRLKFGLFKSIEFRETLNVNDVDNPERSL
jgi:hypothetical protein